MNDNTANVRRRLRQSLRKQRRELSTAERRLAGRAVARHVTGLPEFRRARCIAVYVAFDGELPLSAAIRVAQRHGKQLVAPRLSRSGRLDFLPLSETDMRMSPWGIAEPVRGLSAALRRIDLVLTPLVAFDGSGTRLGLGGGHYDRCFHFLIARRKWLRPKLIGVGYAFQQVAQLRRQPWDVPLWAAVTDRGVVRFNST